MFETFLNTLKNNFHIKYFIFNHYLYFYNHPSKNSLKIFFQKTLYFFLKENRKHKTIF